MEAKTEIGAVLTRIVRTMKTKCFVGGRHAHFVVLYDQVAFLLAPAVPQPHELPPPVPFSFK